MHVSVGNLRTGRLPDHWPYNAGFDTIGGPVGWNGGLFVAYALFENPRLFKKYLISSPSLWYHDEYLFQHEEKYFTDNKSLPAKVYLSAGELEESLDSHMATNMIRFGALLESRHYKGLSLVKQFFNGENHCEVVAPAIHAGLKWALKK